MQSITERVHIEKRYGPRRQSVTPDDERDVGTRNNSHTPPPPYSSMPFSSPPPRYVSVIGLDEQQQAKKKTKKKMNKDELTQPDPKVAPVSLRGSSFVEEEGESSSGLPTYDEALNIEHPEDSIVTVQGSTSSSGNSMRVSMV